MAINYHSPGVPFKLTAADMGVPDYGKALEQGIKNAYLPQRQAAELLKMRLANQFQAPRSQRADQFAAAELMNKQQEPYLTAAQARELVSKAIEQEFYNNQLNGNNGGNNGGHRNPPRNNPQFNNQQNNNPDNGYDQTGGNENPPSNQEVHQIVNDRQDYTGMGQPSQAPQIDSSNPNTLPNHEKQIGNFNVTPKEYLNKNSLLETPSAQEMERLKNRGQPKSFGKYSALPSKIADKAMSPIDKNAMDRSNKLIEKENDLALTDDQNAASMQTNANQSIILLDKLLSDSAKLKPYQRGIGFGMALPIGTEAQKFDADNQSYLATVANEFSGPDKSPTDATRYAAEMSKTKRSQTPEARSDLLMFRYGGAQRQQEIAKMTQYLISQGYSQKVRNRLIGEYNQQRPFWNIKDDINGLNTPYINTWKDFVTPEAVYAADQGRSFTPKNQKELESTIPDKNAFKRLIEEEKKYPSKERKFNNFEEAKTYLRKQRIL